MGDTTAQRAGSRLAVRADRAFDGQAAIPGGALVLCADGRIVGVEPGSAAAPDGWPVAEYPDGTVLPGMIDCHVHLCGDSREGALDRLAGYSDEDLDRVIEAALRAQLAAGVTTVRDLGDRRWAVLSWRDRVAAGIVGFPSPAIVASGPPVTTPGGHCWFMGGETGETSNPGALRTVPSGSSPSKAGLGNGSWARASCGTPQAPALRSVAPQGAASSGRRSGARAAR